MLYIFRFGVAEGIALFRTVRLKTLKNKRSGLLEVKVPLLKYPVFLRSSTSDALNFEQIFICRQYEPPFHWHKKVNLVIDAGAYIGLASVYFANRYPEAGILAIEPEPSNFNMLKLNTSLYPKVSLIQGAVWNNSSVLTIANPSAKKWAFQVREASNSASTGPKISGIKISDALKLSGSTHIDILKLDVEGAEVEIFSSNYEDWLAKVDLLIVELHDRRRPGCSSSFYSALSKYSFNTYVHGDNVFCVNRQAS